MSEAAELSKYYQDICQEVINTADAEDEEGFREDAFTGLYLDRLIEGAEVEDGNCAYYEARGIKVNGVGYSEDDSVLYLFVSLYKNSPDIFSVTPTEVQRYLNNLKNYFIKSKEDLSAKIEESTEAFDAAAAIRRDAGKIKTVYLYFLTNGKVRSIEGLKPNEDEDITFIPSIWDIERLFRLETSGSARERIEIDLNELAGQTIPATRTVIPKAVTKNKDGNTEEAGGYTVYLATIPGSVLYKIYEKYNSRLLEKNVRAFLQVRGKVNRGIRNTIQSSPEMFLAYNNGLSATADDIEVEELDGPFVRIKKIEDFQIVNGGQTTASVFNSCVKNQKPLENLYIQAKITVLDDHSNIDEMVSKISEYANTQNKVQVADFSANHPFHRAVENYSRTVWAPAKSGGEQQTRWFYERSRGQYSDSRSREKNVKVFDSINPKSQLFTKTELARFENDWDQLPYEAAKGAQTNFYTFMTRIGERKLTNPDQKYFENLIAKAILFKSIYKIVRSHNFKGFYMNIADYTMAYLSNKSGQRINLEDIWKNQDISETLSKAASITALAIHRFIIEDSADTNTTQWLKKKEAWEKIKSLDIPMPEGWGTDFVTIGNKTTVASAQNINSATSAETELIKKIAQIESDVWGKMSAWGKETGKLQKYQNGIAYTLSRYANMGKEPSIKQAKQAVKILKTGFDMGFLEESEIKPAIDLLN